MTWAQFTEEFNECFFNATIMAEYWDQLNSLQQGTMTVAELMNKYRLLLCLCLKAVINEKEKVRRLVKALHPDIAIHVYQRGQTTSFYLGVLLHSFVEGVPH